MSKLDGMDGLDDDLAIFEQTLGSTKIVLASFETEMRSMQSAAKDTGREVQVLSRGIGRELRKSFEGLAFDGMKVSDALKGVAQGMMGAAYNAAINPVAKRMSGLLASGVQDLMHTVLPFANGAPFSQGKVMPFANGGVVSGPVTFPMRGATGLMGEAGPEAIMPLRRGANGKLGVEAAGGDRAVTVVMNIQTPDAEGFRRSQSQIAAQMNRALSRGQRNR